MIELRPERHLARVEHEHGAIVLEKHTDRGGGEWVHLIGLDRTGAPKGYIRVPIGSMSELVEALMWSPAGAREE